LHFFLLLGNAKTLRDIPKEQGLNIYSKLRDFYKKMYSAQYMTLTIHSKGKAVF
jgi:nardilysin